jgi:GNAT superfamily N-acetyltransferase
MNNSKNPNYTIEIKNSLTPEEEVLLEKLKQEIFGSIVDDKEANEDFINIPYAHLLLKDDNKIVGFLDFHRSIGKYEEKDVSIGGLSIGILDDYRHHGYGGMLIIKAMEYLKDQNYDLGFLAAAPGTVSLYVKYGWQVLKVPYTWENVYGDIKSDTDGMILELDNKVLVEKIQRSEKPLHVGRGYW